MVPPHMQHQMLCFRCVVIVHVKPRVKSRVGGHFFLSNFMKDMYKAELKFNDSMLTLCKMLKNIVISAVECKIVGACKNSQDAAVL